MSVMPHKHVRRKGSRAYRTDYEDSRMTAAIQAVTSGRMKLGKAQKEFNVPLSTLSDKVRFKCPKKHGGQICLSPEFENAIVDVLNKFGEWKVPLTEMELRDLVRNYLDLGGITIKKFRDNKPGRDWARAFLRRHGMNRRFAAGIKQSRAKLVKKDIEEYFSNLRESLQGVDPSQIYNYDETNFTDDPSRKKCIVRYGVKRHERVKVFSKQAFSVMFCGSATGEYLPHMVVFKAKNLYEAWTSDEIEGVVYGATESGWFDMKTFEQWFDDVFLPHVRDVEGPKVLIGDNLSSHFSPNVIASCVKHNIRFLTLLPNSTHICQPLDVAVFRPMKVLWRTVLEQWRTESRSTGTIPKETFPRLLNRVYKQLSSDWLVSGFRACGIVPLDPSQVLKRLAGESSQDGVDFNVLNEACVNLLKEHCGAGRQASAKAKRGKKVTPGKAIGVGITDDEKWVCFSCNEEWCHDDDNRWIVCDTCDLAYHLQCSGVPYETKKYYEVDIEGRRFDCDVCKKGVRSKI